MGYTILFFRIPDGTFDFIFNKNIRNKDTRVENLKTKQNILRLRSENVGDSNVITKPPPDSQVHVQE